MESTPTTATVARVRNTGSAHWYDTSGAPVFEVPKADGKGMTKTTLAHARKLNLLPSVTGIIQLLDKPALNEWKTEMACLAILTAPRQPGEKDDAFVVRVLQVERQHEQETEAARDRGKQLHEGIQLYFEGEGDKVDSAIRDWVWPAIDRILSYGERVSSEVVLVGEDYAGCTDLIQDCDTCWRIWDAKSTKKLPNPAQGAWDEHRLQLAAYAKAYKRRLQRAGAWSDNKPIVCANVYISSKEAGQYVVCEHENWEETYERGFAPLVLHWQWARGYRPEVNDREVVSLSRTSVEVENMRAHYVKLTEEAEKNQAALKAKLEAENVTISTLRGQLMQLQTELTVAQKQAVAGKQALASGTAPTTPRPAVIGVKLPGQPAPTTTTPQPAVIPPAPQPTAPTPPRPHNAPPGKKIVWTEGTPTAQPPPGPLPLQ